MSRPISRVLSWTIIHLDNMSPYASSDLPESNAGHTIRSPIRSCSKWGLPSRKLLPVARCALTAPFHPYHSQRNGGLLSAALSVGSRPPDVIWHSTLWSPDFPPSDPEGSDRDCLADSRRIIWPSLYLYKQLKLSAAKQIKMTRPGLRTLNQSQNTNLPQRRGDAEKSQNHLIVAMI